MEAYRPPVVIMPHRLVQRSCGQLPVTPHTINDGVLSTADFSTSTRSLNFAGDGSIDMRDRTIDMTMRLNARGLLGFLTLPLRPFSGLFQFRGTGPLKSPEWKHMKFTTPGGRQNEILLAPPKARVVDDGR